MASPSPLLYDTYYHIYNRGINGENIFIEERNYEYFLKLYVKHVEPVAQTFAYSLLRNHFHTLIKTKTKEEIQREVTGNSDELIRTDFVSKSYSDFFNAYAKAINRAYQRTGSLFQHPFGRVPITSERQFWHVVAYIHQNPQKHGFVDNFQDWKWSSYGTLLSEKPTRLKREMVLNWFGGRQGYLDLHVQWVSEAKSKWFATDDFD